MGRRPGLLIICWAMILWGAWVVPAAAETRRIVLLSDETWVLPGLSTLDDSLLSTLTANFSDTLEVYHETMDLSRFASSAYQIRLRDFLAAKYSDRKIDVAIAIMGPALDFLLTHGEGIFPGTRVIFCGVDRREIGDRSLPPHVSGVLLTRMFGPTVELALRLHPGTQRVMVVAGTSEFDNRILRDAKEEFRQYEDRVAFTYLTELPLAQLLTELAKVPPQTIVLFTTYFRDGVGQRFVPHDVIERVSAAANAPVYGFVDQYLGRGIVGGSLYGLGPQGPEAAKLALEILKGSRPSRASLLEPELNQLLFDWRQLQRWGISEKSLPAGSQVQFRPLTAWEQYRWQLISIFVALLLQTGIVAWLLRERHRRRTAELQSNTRLIELKHSNKTAEALTASFAYEFSEPLLATALKSDAGKRLLDSNPLETGKLNEIFSNIRQANQRLEVAELGVWSIETKTGRFTNDARDRLIHGHDPAAPPRSLTEARSVVHPADLPGLDAAFAASAGSGRSCRAEYRLAPIPGQMLSERWVEVEGTVLCDTDGRAARLLGVTCDITERKQTERSIKESERILREQLGALPVAIYVTDAAGRITYCNQAAADLWGAKPKFGEDKWCDVARFYHGNGAPMAIKDCPTEIALKQGRVVRNLEVILERPDGARTPIIPCPTPLRDGAGAVVGVLNMMVDISERKKAERALAERNVQLALAGKAALVGSYAYDPGTDVMRVDEGYVAVHGLPEGTTETTRRAWQARAHPQDLPRVEEVRRQAFLGRWREYEIEYRIVRAEGDIRWIESRSSMSYTPDGRPHRVVGVNIDVTERKQAEQQQRALIAELDHRVKNVLATVSAVAAQTLDASSSMDHFVSAFDGRLRSMAKTHELLSERRWRGIPLAELLRRELAPYTRANNNDIGGPEVILSAEAGQVVGMALHELATNAAKHGALSTREGRVSVQWRRQLNGGPRAGLVIEWQETGGPPAEAESKAGYGMSVIREGIPHELGGKVNYVLAREGARCQFEIPGRWVDAPSFDLNAISVSGARPADLQERGQPVSPV